MCLFCFVAIRREGGGGGGGSRKFFFLEDKFSGYLLVRFVGLVRIEFSVLYRIFLEFLGGILEDDNSAVYDYFVIWKLKEFVFFRSFIFFRISVIF